MEWNGIKFQNCAIHLVPLKKTHTLLACVVSPARRLPGTATVKEHDKKIMKDKKITEYTKNNNQLAGCAYICTCCSFSSIFPESTWSSALNISDWGEEETKRQE